MKQKPDGFLTKLYDFWQPHLDQEEFQFFREKVSAAGGPALELACGSGRLLLPLAKEGYDIEGVESSRELVDFLKRRMKNMEIDPKIYHQRLENLEIKKKYKLIFITLGSLQLIADPEDVKLLLMNLKRMLLEGGEIIISLFLPWIGRQFESDRWIIVSDVTDRETKMRYIRREKSHHDPIAQLISGSVRYEVWKGKDILELEERELFLRWYSSAEFRYRLLEAGFSKVIMKQHYLDTSVSRPGFMLFTAQK